MLYTFVQWIILCTLVRLDVALAFEKYNAFPCSSRDVVNSVYSFLSLTSTKI